MQQQIRGKSDSRLPFLYYPIVNAVVLSHGFSSAYLLARAAKTPVQGKFPEEIKAIHTNIRSAIVSSSPLMSNHQTALKEQWVMSFPERR